MNINNNKITLPLILSFLIFSILLNSMGVIILQLSQHISYKGLGFLESFKDIPMAVVSLFCVNLIRRTGNKNALIFSLVFIILSCIALPLVDAFWFFKIWLSIVGVSFALAKISVFSIIKDNFKDEQLASTMSRVEASFMIGIFIVNIGFGSLLSSDYAAYWKYGFWIIAVLSIVTLILLKKTAIEQSNAEKSEFTGGLSFLRTPRILIFFVLYFYWFLLSKASIRGCQAFIKII